MKVGVDKVYTHAASVSESPGIVSLDPGGALNPYPQLVKLLALSTGT